MLRHWRQLTAHAASAVDAITAAEAEDADVRQLVGNPHYDPQMRVVSIARSRQLTATLIAHVEKLLAVWEAENYEKPLKSAAIRALYLDEERTSLKQVAATLNVPVWDLSQALERAKRELTAQIFGVDGVYTRYAETVTS